MRQTEIILSTTTNDSGCSGFDGQSGSRRLASLAALGIFVLAVVPVSAQAAGHRHHRHSYRGGNTVRGGGRFTHITDLTVFKEADGTRLIITADKEFMPQVAPYEHPFATVITLPGIWSGVRGGSQAVNSNGVENIRYGQLSRRPLKVRIVAYGSARLPHSSVSTPDHRRWEIKIWSPNANSDVVAKGIQLSPLGAAVDTKPTVVAAVPPPVAADADAMPEPVAASSVTSLQKLASTVAKPAVAPTPPKAVPAPKPAPTVKPAQENGLDDKNKGVYPSLLHTTVRPPLLNRTGVPVNLVSPRAAGTMVAAAAGFAPTMTTAQVGDNGISEKRVSLDFIAADINDVLKAMSLQSGINIVTGNDVKGNITVALTKVPLSEAMDMVTRLSGYKYDRFGSAYVVGTPASVGAITSVSGKDEIPVTEFIPYRYVSQSSLHRALLDKFPGIAIAPPDKVDQAPANAAQPKLLVLTDKKVRVAEAREFVERLEQAVSVPSIGAVTEVYRVKYASAPDLVRILVGLVPTINVQLGPAQGFNSGSSGASASYSGGGAASSSASGGSGTASPSTALTSGVTPVTLLLTGAQADISRAREVLDQLDLRTNQLSFDAKVVDINRSDIDKIGFKYDFNNGSYNGVRIGEKDTGTNGIDSQTSAGGRRPNFGAIFRTPYSIGVQLDALITSGHGRIVSNPNLSAIEGQPAVVFIGDQIKYVISQQVTQTGTTIQTETATVGITLKVTGKSSPDGTITLYIHPEVSTITSYLTLASGVALPQISTRYVDTTVRVKDGETIGIGGLLKESDVTTIQKVPFLGDLPFFGELFRHKDKTKDKSELVVLITSRILKD